MRFTTCSCCSAKAGFAMLGAMKSHLVKVIVLSCVVVVGACSKSRTRRAEVVECSSISLDAKGTTLCLVQLYHWKLPAAQKAANDRAHETDSIKTWQEDSVWGDMELRSEEHTSELQSRLHLVCRLLLEKKKKNMTS